MRKVILSAVCLSALLALSACGSGAKSADDPVVTSTTTTTTTATTTAPSPTDGTSTAPTTTPTTAAPAGPVVTVAYAGGKVTGDTGRTKAKVGQTITLRVTSDSKQQVHIHGADILFDVLPGTPVEKTFTEKAPGIYEIELHPSDFVLARVEVS